MSDQRSSLVGRDPFLPTGGIGLFASLSTGVLVFLCVLSMALSGAAVKMSDRWSNQLVQTATIRLAPAETVILDEQTAAIQTFLSFTPGVEGSSVLDRAETEEIMREWVGDEIDLNLIVLPRIIRLRLSNEPFDAAILVSQLEAAAPGAYFDDHSQWRASLERTITVLRMVSFGMVGLLLFALTVLIWLALKSAIAANTHVIATMRQLGAENRDITLGFVRRYVGLIGLGSLIGFLFGSILLLLVPEPADGEAFLADLVPKGAEWIWFAATPSLTLALAYIITRLSVQSVLETRG